MFAARNEILIEIIASIKDEWMNNINAANFLNKSECSKKL